MEEEVCLVDSCTTNTILRESLYFQTLKKSKGNVTTIAGCDAVIIGSGRSTITLPMGTQLEIEDALLYPDSTCTLLSLRISVEMGYILKPIMSTMRSSFS